VGIRVSEAKDLVRMLRRNRVTAVRWTEGTVRPHAFRVRCRWDEENRRHVVSIVPGTVNGMAPVVQIDGSWVDLDAAVRPVLPVVPTRWKTASFGENRWLEARYGQDVAAASFRITETGATSKALAAVTSAGVPTARTAADRRMLVKQTVQLSAPMPTLRAEIDPKAVAAGDANAAQMVVVPAQDAVVRLLLGDGEATVAADPVWAGVPGLEELGGVQAADARQVVAQIWAVGPAGVEKATPDETWAIHVEQVVFRPLMFGVRLPDWTATSGGDGLLLPPLGAGSEIIRNLIEDGKRRNSLVVGQAAVTGKFWSV
jgi:hypothetical protein